METAGVPEAHELDLLDVRFGQSTGVTLSDASALRLPALKPALAPSPILPDCSVL